MTFSNKRLFGKFHELYLCAQKHKIYLCGKFHGQLWTINISASNHVSRNLNIMSNVRNAWCIVGFPNGKKVVEKHEGYVKLIDDIALIHVLYVP